MDPEVVAFTVPAESNKVVFVWNITARLSEGEIYCSLMKVFSQFGPLYCLKLFPNAGVADPGYYAVIRYFSSQCAKKAHVACDRKSLFQDTPLKVQVCNRKKSLQFKSLELYGYKCKELANYYLGFNGWSQRVIAIQNITGLDDDPGEEGSPKEQAKLRYLCVVEVIIHDREIRSRGVGVAEEAIEKQNDNGKVAVEYVPDEDDTVDCLTEEELQGLIQVNDFTWATLDIGDEDDEEMLANLSFYEDTLADGE
ncbi:RAD52 motif-containing protein 1 isoform X2 [Lithobates pipiens]